MTNSRKKRERLNLNGTPVIWWIGTSTKHQKHSPIVQFDWCWNTSVENNFYPVSILRVPGHSRNYIFFQDAAKVIPAYSKLFNLLKSPNNKKPKLLLTMARDRLGRNALAIQVEALCDEAGCQIWSGRTGQPIDGNVGQIFASGMELTLSRAESYQTQERRRGAVIRRVQEKKLPYGKPEYGYKIIRDEKGKSVGVDINPTTAPIRQLIDKWFIDGNSPQEIALRLQRKFTSGNSDYAPPAKSLWHANVIRKLLLSKYPMGEYKATLYGKLIIIQGNHQILRTKDQQAAIERQFTRRKRGSQRGNTGETRYYGIAYCADCNSKMIRIRTNVGSRNTDVEYTCSQYRYSLRTLEKTCSSHYTYEKQITDSIIKFFQQPVDETLLKITSSLSKDNTNEIEAVQKELEIIKKKKVNLIKLKIDYKVAEEEFSIVINELEKEEKDTKNELENLKKMQVKRPDIESMKNWISEMLQVPNLREWLELEDPKIIRSILGERIRVKCYQRKYKKLEPAPSVELVY